MLWLAWASMECKKKAENQKCATLEGFNDIHKSSALKLNCIWMGCHTHYSLYEHSIPNTYVISSIKPFGIRELRVCCMLSRYSNGSVFTCKSVWRECNQWIGSIVCKLNLPSAMTSYCKHDTFSIFTMYRQIQFIPIIMMGQCEFKWCITLCSRKSIVRMMILI